MQGVEIDDKHVEVMVRQMLRKVRIIEAGDTKLLPGSLVDIHNFTDANREAFKERKRPATAKPVLLGITKASLETESFYLRLHSKKLLVYLLMLLLKVNAMTYLDLKRMLLSVNLSQLVQV